MIRSKSLALTAAIAAAIASQGVSAKSVSTAEVRGLKSCITAAEENGLRGVSTRPTYFIRETADRTFYYVNVYGWDETSRVSKRIRCETANKGLTLHSAELADGHYDTDERSVLKTADRAPTSSAQSSATGGR